MITRAHKAAMLLVFFTSAAFCMESPDDQKSIPLPRLLTSIQPMVVDGLSKARKPAQSEKKEKKQTESDQLRLTVNAQINSPQDVRINKIFDLLKKSLKNRKIQKSSELPENTLRELNIFTNTNAEWNTDNLAQRIHHTLTDIGYVQLCINLSCLKNTEEISQQKALIEVLAGDKSKLDEIRAILAECKELEGTFLTFCMNAEPDDINDPLAVALVSKRLPNNELNTNPFMCQLSECLDHLKTVGAGMPALAAAGAKLVLAGISKDPILIIQGIRVVLEQLFLLPDKYYKIKLMLTYNLLMQKKLIAVSNLVKKMKLLNALLQEILPSELIEKLLLSKNASDKVNELLELLEKNTFSDSASYVAYWGRIHATYRLMQEHSNHFLEAYASLGEIDYLTSLANIVSTQTETPYCLPDVIQETNALLQAQNLHNPLLNNSVPSNLVIGRQGEHRAIILTGPNDSGKTTVLRLAGLGALMAQTITLVPATSCTLTPMQIFTAIHIRDDLSQGQGLHQAAVARAQEILKAIQSRHFYLILLDEPFTGTKASIAVNLLINALPAMARTNTLLLVTSHFIEIRALEKKNETFANYHVVDYRLERGTNDENYEKKIKEFIDQYLGADVADQVGRNQHRQAQDNETQISQPVPRQERYTTTTTRGRTTTPTRTNNPMTTPPPPRDDCHHQ